MTLTAAQRPNTDRSPHPQLAVHTAAANDDPVLVCFQPGVGAIQWPIVPIGLTALGPACDEDWQVAKVQHSSGQADSHCAFNDHLMMAALECEDEAADPADMVQRCYQDLLARVHSTGYPHLLRIWNYLPAINAGAGDQERYRRFCVGRARAMAEYGLASDQMCAATAIGCHDQRFRLFALAGKAPGQSIENPRQLSAWQYPADYGPVSPAFARATALSLANHQVGLLVSGTASVLGHETAHVGDVQAQTEEALRNLDSVLAAAAQRMNAPGLGQLNERSVVRVYVRHASDWPVVEAALAARWPQVTVMGLHGDVCRAELLVELEAWHCAEHKER